MKKWLFTLVAVLTLSACAAAPGTDSAQSSFPAPDLSQSTSSAPDSPLPASEIPAAPEQTPAPLPSGGLTEADARRIALEHAGLSESDVAFIRTDKERDNGRMEYEVEFSGGAIKYDYTIDAETGEILSFESDDADENVTFSFDAADAPPPVIGQDEAKSVALTHAGVSETDASRMK
ncbi:MAG: PepSY domain-containing protein, partial [Oscillibacter sp.]|nr:PepSY domain-containing protein [Oscillibacter sp.]